VPPPDEATTRIETSPELLEALRDDEGERPTVRLPSRPPFAQSEEEAAAALEEASSVLDEPLHEATIRGRVIVGPDGIARLLDDTELEEATRPHIPSRMLLRTGKTKKKR